MNILTHDLTPKGLAEWRERTFPAETTVASRVQAAEWYGVTLRAWEQYEYGERPIPKPLQNRIRDHASHGRSPRRR